MGVFAAAVPLRITGVWPGALDTVLATAVVLATAGTCLHAAHRERRRKAALASWSLLALVHLGGAGSHDRLVSQLSGTQPFDPASFVSLVYFSLALTALWLLLREGMPRWLPGMWGDAVVVGLGALAGGTLAAELLLPDSFLPLAAQTGLMRPVAALVLDRALGACARWWRRGHHLPVSVNLTADDLHDPQMSRRLVECLARHALPGQALRIEITEDVLLTDPEAAAQLLQSWRRAGIAVALDDFGTGYSSLAYLRELPFDELKLDRCFVADLHRRTTATIVRHTVSMAHGLGMRVVAEGVEDQITARTLADVGCDLGQGLYFGAAMAPQAFLDHLESAKS